ncbi:MAG: TonB-dependent receptor [Pseudomonadales bacterium]
MFDIDTKSDAKSDTKSDVRSSAMFRRSALFAAVISTAAGSVWAQEQNSFLEEVLVSASKRSETLQDSAIAVTVISGDVIEQTHAIDLFDMSSLAPSFRARPSARAGAAVMTIRGFTSASAAGSESSIGMFVDGVYRPRSQSQVMDLPRLERIEVLAGPQSTLFGKNASAGVISLVTKAPTQEFDAKVSATLGNYDHRQVKGYVSGGVSDTVALSLSGSSYTRDGYTESLTGLQDLNDKDRWNLRGQALWQPTDDISIRVIADYGEIDEVCCSASAVQVGPTGAIIESLGAQTLDPERAFEYESYLNHDQTSKIDDGGISVHADFAFDSFLFTSITAYRENSVEGDGDIDYTSVDIARGISYQESEMFTQELRLTSTGDSRLQWMAGAYFFREDIELGGVTEYGVDLRNYMFTLSRGFLGLLEAGTGNAPGTFFPAGLEIEGASALENDTYSFFGTADFDLTDRLIASAGINYTKDEKEATITTIQNEDVFSALDLDEVLGGAFARFAPFQFRPPQLGLPNSVESNETSDDATTWMVRLAYEINDNINIYGKVATGFKASSWDLTGFSSPLRADAEAIAEAGLETPNQQYGSRFSDPEQALVYEFGLKAFYDNFYVTLAVFNQQIEDFQTRGFDGVRFISTNAGEVEIKGVEFDLNYAPVESWVFRLAGTYLDPEYVDYKNAPPSSGGAAPIDRSGTRPGGIPEWSLVGSATYNFNVGANANGFVRADYVYEEETEINDSFPGVTREIGTFNASAGIDFSNGLSASLWGRNLNNDEYFHTAFAGVAQPGTVNSWPSQPRTYGVTLAYRFQ